MASSQHAIQHGTTQTMERAMTIRIGLSPHGPCGAAALTSTLFLILLAGVSTSAHAASVYKCVGMDGGITFRDTPCSVHARQTKLNIPGLPLMDPGAPTPSESTHSAHRSRAHPQRTRGNHRSSLRKHKTPMSWECRAADGEVFYRHKRCPSSVPGDGVVRTGYAQELSRLNGRKRRNAWSRVRVRGKRIPRAEACRLIRAASASARDGHLRDAQVSTYDHLMGRDPCGGG
jgi:hypothetical protein